MNPDGLFSLADRLCAGLRAGEVLLCGLKGERSDFVRLNRSRIRQAGCVRRHRLALKLIEDGRQIEGGCDLGGGPDSDFESAFALLRRLRERMPHTPQDPYLHFSTQPGESDRRIGESLPDAREAVAQVIEEAAGTDLVGIWASGEISRGLASSLGHRHWHQATSFNLDFSCHLGGGRAVKEAFGGSAWERQRLHEKLDAVRGWLEVLSRRPRTIQPGRYRAYLAPAAVQELLDMLAWGGFGLKDHRTAQTPLLRLVQGERRLDARVTIREECGRGLAPSFTPDGFEVPGRVTLIDSGAYVACLADSRSAREYGVAVNAASECPESLALEAGEIPAGEILARLGTGLYIGNLWYLNYADRNDCRITGMTRFGTFWVDGGRLVAPVEVMRFDDSLYRLLGDRLEGLTRGRELMLTASSYGGRSTASSLLPGILVEGIEFVL